MSSTSKDTVRQKAIALLHDAPDGLRFSDLLKKLHQTFPDIPPNTVRGSIWNLDAAFPELVTKRVRGLFVHTTFSSSLHRPDKHGSATASSKVREEDFYDAFADWIVDDLEECTKAIALGRNKFRDKWGTPDVVGIRAPRKSDIVQSPTEIISAEIKVDGAGLITAFGQACAYKLFSHKSYIVVPQDSSQEDLARLDALCLVVGIGLILFDTTSVKNPNFQIRVRALRHEPDMFYVNKNMREVEDQLFS